MFHYKNLTLKGGVPVPSESVTKVASPTKTSRRRKSRRALLWLILGLVAAGIAGWFGWEHFWQTQTQAAPATVAVTRADVQQTVLANGILQANSLVSVGAQVSGRIEKLDVKVDVIPVS